MYPLLSVNPQALYFETTFVFLEEILDPALHINLNLFSMCINIISHLVRKAVIWNCWGLLCLYTQYYDVFMAYLFSLKSTLKVCSSSSLLSLCWENSPAGE